jgi:hypothetical protein
MTDTPDQTESSTPAHPGPPAPDTDAATKAPEPPAQPNNVPEIGGRGGPDPTRYGDWEKNGRCVDF